MFSKCTKLSKLIIVNHRRSRAMTLHTKYRSRDRQLSNSHWIRWYKIAFCCCFYTQKVWNFICWATHRRWEIESRACCCWFQRAELFLFFFKFNDNRLEWRQVDERKTVFADFSSVVSYGLITQRTRARSQKWEEAQKTAKLVPSSNLRRPSFTK